jgi:NAD(P)-dependent dehydrogenase (short-subunit alcohol dehydrogenase family)
LTEDRDVKRVVLVTGSTSGIGMAIAKRLAEDGFTVAFHSKSSVLAGQSLAEVYSGASYFQADLSDQSQARDLIAKVLSHTGD